MRALFAKDKVRFAHAEQVVARFQGRRNRGEGNTGDMYPTLTTKGASHALVLHDS